MGASSCLRPCQQPGQLSQYLRTRVCARIYTFTKERAPAQDPVQKQTPVCPTPAVRPVTGQALATPQCPLLWSLGPWCLTGPLPRSQPPALSQLVSLYLGRSHFLWKEPATMSWLEENVRKVLQAVDAGDPAVEACESR